MLERVRKFMWQHINEFVESDFGILVNTDELVRYTAEYFECEDWLEDPEHWIWEVGKEVSDELEQ